MIVLYSTDSYWSSTTPSYHSHYYSDFRSSISYNTLSSSLYSSLSLPSSLFPPISYFITGAVPLTLEESVKTAALLLPQKAICTLPNAKKIKCFSYNPGLMLDTSFASSSLGAVIGWIVYILVPVLRFTPLGPLMRTAPLSGSRLGRLAVGEIGGGGELQGGGGGQGGGGVAAYYCDESEVPSSAFSRSLEAVTKLQKELWDLSILWAGVTKEDLSQAGL
jgi:hypothetical protein